MPEIDFDSTPHFSRGGATHAAKGTILLILDLFLPIAVGLLGLVAIQLLFTQITIPVHPVIWLSGLAFVVGIVAWNRWGHARRVIRQANDISSLPFEPDDRYRVRVICWPDELRTLSNITADTFEPERFRAILPDSRVIDLTKPHQQLWSFLGLPFACVQFLVHAPPWLGLSVLAVVCLVVAYLLRLPTYLRFSPNRLEIIRFAIGRTRPRHTQTFQLDRPVTISTKGFGNISWTDDNGSPRSLPMLFIVGRREAIRAAIAAALSQHATPVLDSL